MFSAVFIGGAGGALEPPEFGGSQKGQSQISAYQSLAITTNTPGFEKLNMALLLALILIELVKILHKKGNQKLLRLFIAIILADLALLLCFVTKATYNRN